MNISILKKTYYFLIVILGILGACKTPQATLSSAAVPSDSLENLLNSGQYRLINQRPHIPVWLHPSAPYQASRTRKHDLLHTQLDISFDWPKRQVIGLARLTLKPYFYPQNTLELDARGFKILHVKLQKDKEWLDLKYDYDQKKLNIQLDQPYSKEDTFAIEIDYIASPEKLNEKGDDQGLYFINPDGTDSGKPQQIWTQGETAYNSGWFPTLDAPNERCTQEIYITVDKKFMTLSNGEYIYGNENADGTRTDYWKMDQAHAPYLFMMVVGEFALVKDSWQDKEVNYYVEPKYAPYAKDIFGKTPEMIEFFSEKLDYPFPWNKYAQVVVRDYVSGAMENTTASVFMEDLQVDDRALLDDHWEGIIAHELFHQWFGDLVTCESWANLPLNEAFANYSEYLWAEYKYGRAEADYLGHIELLGYLQETEEKREALIRYHHADKEDMFDAHSYNKGGRVLHMLRIYVGDEAFWQALGLYLKTHAYQSVEIHDLRKAFEKVTGEDLNWFFDQWFLAPGHPDISVNHQYQEGNLILQVTQNQDSLYTPIYRLPLKIAIWVNGEEQIYPIVIDKAQQAFSFELESNPDLILFDVEQQLLGTVYHPKSLEELAFQYQHTDKYLAKYDALSQLDSINNIIVQSTYQAALSDTFWGIRDMAISYFLNHPEQMNPSILKKVKQMSRSDSRSYVRAAAIDLLGQLENAADFIPFYRQGLNDSAYSVVAASLYALWQSESQSLDKMTEIMERYEDWEDPSVIQTVAEYFVSIRHPDKFSWLIQQSLKQKGYRQYQLIQFIGSYLQEGSSEEQKEGLKVLANFALGNYPELTKFSAFQTLYSLKELPGFQEKLQEIINKERNPELLDLYKLFEE